MVAIAFAIRRAKIFAIAVPITPKPVPNSQQRKRHNKPQPQSQLSPRPKSQKIPVRLRSKMNHGFLINYLKVSKISLMKNLENQLNIKILLIGWKIQDFIFWMQSTIAGLTRNVCLKKNSKMDGPRPPRFAWCTSYRTLKETICRWAKQRQSEKLWWNIWKNWESWKGIHWSCKCSCSRIPKIYQILLLQRAGKISDLKSSLT